MSEKIPVQVRPAAVGKVILDAGLGWGTVPTHGRQGYSLLGRWNVESQFRRV